MSKEAKTCQMTMSDNGKGPTGIENFWACEAPAVAWIVDTLKRTGWGGRQYLCRRHRRLYNVRALKSGKPPATMIDD